MKTLDAVRLKVVVAPAEEPPRKHLAPYTYAPGQWYQFGDKSGIFMEVVAGKIIMLMLWNNAVYFLNTPTASTCSSPPIPVNVTFQVTE